MAHERRHFIRVTFDAPATLTTATGSFIVHIEDLSLKGALVDLPGGIVLPLGTQCQLSLALSSSTEHIVMMVDVARGYGQHTGLRCISMDLDSVTHLRRLIEWQLGDATLLERDLGELCSRENSELPR